MKLNKTLRASPSLHATSAYFVAVAGGGSRSRQALAVTVTLDVTSSRWSQLVVSDCQMSGEQGKKPTTTFHHSGCFIGIPGSWFIIIAIYGLGSKGSIIYTLKQQGLCEALQQIWSHPRSHQTHQNCSKNLAAWDEANQSWQTLRHLIVL